MKNGIDKGSVIDKNGIYQREDRRGLPEKSPDQGNQRAASLKEITAE